MFPHPQFYKNLPLQKQMVPKKARSKMSALNISGKVKI
jgi:hypothetical protein